MLRTIILIGWVLFSTIVGGMLVLLIAPFSRNGNAPHCIGRIWARLILLVGGVDLKINGKAHLDPEKAYIFMPNHQSMIDIPVIYTALYHQFRWVAKAELFKIPLFGESLKRCGYISIDRSNRKAAFASLREAVRKIRKGASVLIFPEGTRSDDGTILPFKKGGFVMAVEAQAMIVPMVITGTRSVMSKGKLQVTPGKVLATFHPPIDAGEYSRKAMPQLLNKVEMIITDGFYHPPMEGEDA